MTILSLRRARRCTAAWLALASMALNAAWPLIANARPAVQASPEICSATGINHASGGAPVDSPNSAHRAHCPLCPCHAERGLPVAHVGQPLIAAEIPSAQVFPRAAAPRPETALHFTARPRAPPSVS